METQINKWLLEDGPYYTGIDLLRQVCGKQRLISLLSKRESPKNRAKLKYELSKHTNLEYHVKEKQEIIQPSIINDRKNEAKESESSSISKSQRKHVQSTHGQNTSVLLPDGRVDNIEFGTDLSSIKQKLISNRNSLYKQRAHFHGQLHIASTKPKRFELAKKIMTIQPKIDNANRHIKYIELTGSIPPELKIMQYDAATFQRIDNIRTYISRYKKKLKQATETDKINRYQLLLDKYKQELESLVK